MPEVQNLSVDAVREAFNSALGAALTLQELDDIRVRFTGKKGELTVLLRSLGKLPQEERKNAGQAVNALRDEIEARLEDTGRLIRDAENERTEKAEEQGLSTR